MKTERASIGVALMARDAAETLPKCLDSLRPFVQQIVVGVDVTTTDKTAKVAKKHGADIVFPLTVSEEHTCPRHGTIQAQHFARARQATWAKLDPSLDFHLWIDADDILKGGEKLLGLTQRILASPAIGAWFSYHYATLKDGAVTNTLFHRERLCRTHRPDGVPIVWEWQQRVHEVIAPKNVPQPQWLINDQECPEVFHQEGRHSSHNSSTRNLTLLEIDLEENPNDHRAMFYMGNQMFALGRWAEAIYWFERLGQVGKNHYELWQAWTYASIAYERLGDLNGATQAAYAAMDVEPKHPEPYQRLASIALLAGEFEKCLYWTTQARTKEEPPFFVFKNPLDYSFNIRMPAADALAALGRVPEARAELEEAYKAMPDERVATSIAHYQGLERDHAVANAFLTLNHGQDDAAVIANYENLNLPMGVRQFGRLRDRVMPAYIRRRSTSQRRIVFYCGRSLEEWSPLSLTTTGIGGSETAVVEIAKRFAADDWRVDVYNGAGRYEGEYGGVGYWDPERLGNADCDVWVSWRQPQMLAPGKASQSILWLHDLNYGPKMNEAIRQWDRDPSAVVCGVSQWHAEMLGRYYDLERSNFIPNGIDLNRFLPGVRKGAFQCVYASSPDRGLDRLLALWPSVLRREPGAVLHVGYGWDNIDRMIQQGRGDLAAYKAHCVDLMAKLGKSVVWHGRLPQDELARLYQASAVWTYPTSFLEVSCISAMEAMAAGAVPVTSRVGALPETIGGAGVLVEGMPESRVWSEFYVNCLLGVLTAPNLRKPLEYRARQRAEGQTWDKAFEAWQRVLSIPQQVETTERELVAV